MEYMLAKKILELSEEEIVDLLDKIRNEDVELYSLFVSILQEL